MDSLADDPVANQPKFASDPAHPATMDDFPFQPHVTGKGHHGAIIGTQFRPGVINLRTPGLQRGAQFGAQTAICTDPASHHQTLVPRGFNGPQRFGDQRINDRLFK